MYVHLPFCRRRCRYCSFAIVPVGEGGGGGSGSGRVAAAAAAGAESTSSPRDDLMERYTDAVVREIRQQQQQQQQLGDGDGKCKNGTSAAASITSLYLGGGTPSLVPVPMLRRIVDEIRRQFEVAPHAECTMEMDPGTFDLKYLQDVVDKLGCNRVSLGVQSLNDTILRNLGRQHTVHDAVDALNMVRDHAAATNAARQQQHNDHSEPTFSYSVDLISSVPGLSLAEWCRTLQIVVDNWAPPHISVYDLQVEKGTVFGAWYGSESATAPTTTSASQRLVLPTEDESAFMYRYASAYLQARGYEHYEVSSFARRDATAEYDKGKREEGVAGSTSRASSASPLARSPSPHRSRHNQVYWDPDGSWYGFGVGATSHLEGRSAVRPRTLHEYFQHVDRRAGAEDDETGDSATVSDDEDAASTASTAGAAALDLCENIVLKRLRTADGLDLDRDVAGRFGEQYADAVLRGASLGLELRLATLVVDDDDDDSRSRTLRLTVPDGFLLSNSILSSIFVALEALPAPGR
jgi:coproporphyrinogen III oxidase-like Fe-S oxidoreductase